MYMNSKFGESLRNIRKRRGLSQDELAALLGTSKQVISRYETGQRFPKITVAIEYAKILGVSLAELNGITEEQQAVYNKAIDGLQKDDKPPESPKTPEARIVSFGMDQLPQADREQILNVIRAMYAKRPELFRKDDNDDA